MSQVDTSESRDHLTARLDSIAAQAVLADQPAIAQQAREASAAVSAQDSDAAAAAISSLAAAVQPAPAAAAPAPAEPDIEEDDLRDIFLEEAREVVGNGLAAIEALAAAPTDVSELTTLRRAFHTLKGSSRMVGLTEFGEAAWSLEQVLNTWLADQKPANEDLRSLAGDAMRGFARWVEDIAAGSDGAWKAGMFRGPADSFRTGHGLVPIQLPSVAPEPVPETPAAAIEAVELSAPVMEPAQPPVPQPESGALPELEISLDAFEAGGDRTATSRACDSAAPAAEPLSFEFDIEPAQVPAAADEPVSFGTTHVLRGAAPEAAEIPAHEALDDFDFDIEASPGGRRGARRPPRSPSKSRASTSKAWPRSPGPLRLPRRWSPPQRKRPRMSRWKCRSPKPRTNLSSTCRTSTRLPRRACGPKRPRRPRLEPAESVDEQVKVIGTLRIGIPLYNVYLNEADEWSRRLATEVAEWALELNQPIADSTVGLAHALAGSSATVGFHALSDIARALESALGHTQVLAYGTAQHGKAFTDAAEEIRRLLHQFAAGFLKEADPGIIEALVALNDLEIPQREDLPVDSLMSGFDELEPRAPAPAPLAAIAPAPEAQPVTPPPSWPPRRPRPSAAAPAHAAARSRRAAGAGARRCRLQRAGAGRPRRGRRGRSGPVPDLRGRGGRTDAAAGRRPAPVGRAARKTAARATRCCAHCTRSRAAPGWPAPCGWANWRTAWSRRSSTSAPSTWPPPTWTTCCSASTACRPTSTPCAPPAGCPPRLRRRASCRPLAPPSGCAGSRRAARRAPAARSRRRHAGAPRHDASRAAARRRQPGGARALATAGPAGQPGRRGDDHALAPGGRVAAAARIARRT